MVVRTTESMFGVGLSARLLSGFLKRNQHLGPSDIYLDDLPSLDSENVALYFPKRYLSTGWQGGWDWGLWSQRLRIKGLGGKRGHLRLLLYSSHCCPLSSVTVGWGPGGGVSPSTRSSWRTPTLSTEQNALWTQWTK